MLELNKSYELKYPKAYGALLLPGTWLKCRAEDEADFVNRVPLERDRSYNISLLCRVNTDAVLPGSSLVVKIRNAQSIHFQKMFERGGRLRFVYASGVVKALIVDALGNPAYEIPTETVRPASGDQRTH